jgi:hypothetical protein
MAAITTLTIGGKAIDLAAYPLGKLVAFAKDGIPSLSLYRRGGVLPGLPDPWLGKPVVLTINDTTYFQGDVVSVSPDYERIGWVLAYQCLGLRYRGNLVPFTDDNTGLDTAPFNLQPEDPSYIASRAGRTVGQILTAVLTMATNATNLNNVGLGGYTSLSPPTLPAATVADLAALVMIPPAPVYVGGEKLIGALDGLLAQWAPNYTLWIDPSTGNLRFLDLRTFTAHTFTLGTDPIEPTPLSRDTTDCFPRVEVRGQPLTEPWMLSLSNQGLAEAFAHDGLTNAQAKAAWVPSNFAQPGAAQDQGTCTCPSTTTVTVTSSNATTTWGVNFWDQTNAGRHGIVTLAYPAGTGLTQFTTRRVIANTALTAAGSSTLTLDLPIPITSYTKYTLFGLQGGASIVWRKYQATDAAVGAALQNFFAYPVPYVGAGGASVSLTSAPIGSVLWSSNGNPPYNEFPLPFTQDPSSGTFLFVKPTFEVANNAPPADVRVLAAVATGVNQVFAPANAGGNPQYAGTSNTVEGLTRTLVVTVDAWRDPGNATAMAAYAADLLESVKDTVVEGEITYLGLFEPALTMGLAANVTGLGYTTGWENLSSFVGHPGLPIVEVELAWNYQGPVSHTMRLRCSNRRAHYTAGMFLKPDRAGLTWGSDEVFHLALEHRQGTLLRARQ